MHPESSLPRSAGILLHPTSLPGPGIGDLGPSARRFAELVADMGMRWWQMLPVGPTGYGDSPYQSPSTFAGNPILISPEDLVADGLLDATDAERSFDPDEVDFGPVIAWKREILDTAVHRFLARPRDEGFVAFSHTHGTTWLDDFALFTAIKRSLGLRPWWEWPDDLVRRRPDALEAARTGLADSVEAIRVEQFLFDRQFTRLRAECRDRGVSLIGDIPIFVAHDSADVWANPDLYWLEDDGSPSVVAGVPPDYFSETGQRWGNPLYRWERHQETDFAWWTARMRRVTSLFDLVRVDHFRGFAASWHIPADAPTAIDGTWVPAPGEELFVHLESVFGDDLPVIAEDLGLITPDVEELRDEFGLPGMKVLQFGFGTESAHAISEFRPHVIAYTGTHDNDTAQGWFESEDPDRVPERALALESLESDGTRFAWDLVTAVFESVAAVAVVPLQDLLGLGTEARMNTPGTAAGNWRWRFRWEAIGPELIDDVAALVRRTGR